MEPPSSAPSPPLTGDAPEPEVKLAREITLADATLLGVGALMGGGIFVLLGLASGVAGPAVLLSLFLNGIITIPTLLVYVELGTAYHDAGGGYLWTKDALGQPFGFLGGWLGWFSHIIACSLYALASAAFTVYIAGASGLIHADTFAIGPLGPGGPVSPTTLLALLVAALFIGLNYMGVKVGIKAENVINSLVLLVVLGFIAVGLWHVSKDPSQVDLNFNPFFSHGSVWSNLSGIFLAMGITFIAFEGYEIIAQTGEEIQDPQRNVPRAHWYSFLIVWAIMLLVTFIVLGGTHIPADLAAKFGWTQSWQYLGSLGPDALPHAAGQILPYGAIIIAGSALLLQLTALNATIYSSSRVSFAMGRDGNLPRWFAKIHPERKTPHLAVLASGVLVLVVALLPIDKVATSADVMFLLLFTLVNASYIKLRKIIPAERFSWRAPLFPYIPLLGIASKGFLAVYLYNYSPVAWYVTGAWIVVGLLVYYGYVRSREDKASDAQTPLHLVPLPIVRADRRHYRILVLLQSPAPSMARALGRAAGAIAQSLDGEVHFLQPILVPELTPLAEGQSFRRDRTLLAEARASVPAGVPVQTSVRIGHNLEAMVRDAAQEEGASLLLMSGQARPTVGQPTSGLLAYPPCDLALLRLRRPDVGGANVLVTAGTQAGLGIRLGTALAKAMGGRTRVLHMASSADAEGERARTQATVAQSAVPGSATETEEKTGDRVQSVLDASRGQDLVILGARLAPRPWRRSLLGPHTQEIADRATANVLLVRVAAERGSSHWLGRRLLTIQRYFQPE